MLLCGLGGGFYIFNHWFFAKFNTKENNITENNDNEMEKVKESIEEENTQSQVASFTDSTSNKNKIRSTEEYYCSENDIH